MASLVVMNRMCDDPCWANAAVLAFPAYSAGGGHLRSIAQESHCADIDTGTHKTSVLTYVEIDVSNHLQNSRFDLAPKTGRPRHWKVWNCVGD